MLKTLKMLSLRISLCGAIIGGFYCFVLLGTEESFFEFVGHFIGLVGCLRTAWWASGRLSILKARRGRALADSDTDADAARTSITSQFVAALRDIFCRENAVTILLRILQSLAGLVALYCFFAAGQAGDSLLQRSIYYLIMFAAIGLVLFLHTSIPGRVYKKTRGRAAHDKPAAGEQPAPTQAQMQDTSQAQDNQELPQAVAEQARLPEC